MKNYDLGFISNQNLYNHVLETVKKYRFSINLKEFTKNILDPIKLTFDSKIYNRDIENIINDEILRQIDKSNSNHIGYFHQNIFKYIGNDWVVPKNGYDIVNETKNIFVEMKNKHNTMNSSSSQKTYMRMQNTIIKNNLSTCYLVEVMARKSQNIAWVVSLDGISTKSNNIRRMSIDKFYHLVTGDEFAFKKLCKVLPYVLDDILSNSYLGNNKNTVFDELKNISPDIVKSIFLLSFKTYQGFKDF